MFARLLHPVRTEERAEGCTPWRRSTVRRYIRDVRLFRGNAAAALEL